MGKRRITEWHPDAYMSISKAARICGVDRSRMDRWVKLSDAIIGKGGTRGVVAFPKVFDHVQEIAAASASPAEMGEASERYRAAKAEIEEIKVAQLKRELVKKDDVLSWWSAHMAPQIRSATDLLDRRFGQTAGDVIRDLIQRLEDEVERMDDGRESDDADD